MKLDLDKDIDALLRRHARRGTALPGRVDWSPQSEENGATAAMAEASSGLKHLDTDELSAYAENALPGPTRARYAAHLAACDECRRIAIAITLAADVAGELERRERLALPAMTAAAPAQSWHGRLAALFAPGAWRYAVPLVALVLVSGAVWLAILKQRRSAGEVAVRSSVPARSAAVLEKEAHHAPESEAVAPPAAIDTNKSGAPLVTDRKETSPAAATAAGEAARNGEADRPDAANKIATVGPRPTAVDGSVAEGVAAPPAASPPPPPAASTPRAQPEEVAVTRELEAARSANTQELSRGDESLNRGYDNTQRGGGKDNSLNDTQSAGQSRGVTRDQSDDRAKNEESAAAPSTYERSGRRRSPPPPSRSPKEIARDEKESAPAKRSMSEAKRKEREAEAEETRTIAGRRFRRQGGGAWVDTAYQPAQATVNVRRGSEQFRALVADTPELRSIANAFSGEVIVVWQGRAYRIR